MSKEIDLDALSIAPAPELLGQKIYNLIEGIGNARGAKQKQELLQSAFDTWTESQVWVLQQVLKYSYDSSIRFGIASNKIEMPVTLAPHPIDFDSWVFTLLDQVMAETRPSVKKELIEEQLGKLDSSSKTLLVRIIDKDLRAGFGETIINKVCKTLLTKFDVMLAKPFAARLVPSWPMLVEPKLDGLRCIAEVDCGSKIVRFFTRSGKAIDSLSNLEHEVLVFAMQFGTAEIPLPSVAFDCEVTSGTFLESMSSVRSSKEQVTEGTLHVFDVLVRGPGHSPIALSDAELQEQGTQQVRRQRLQAGFTVLKKHLPELKFVKLTESYAVTSEEEVFTMYERCRDAGLEGVIVKDPNAFYVKKRSASWMKIKAEETLDLNIVGAFEGTGKYAGSLGGLVVVNGEVEVRVGSGFSDAQRDEYWAQIQDDLKLAGSGKRSSCVLIDCPAEVQYQEQLPSGSLRHPVFVRLRRDKQLGAVGAF